MPDDRELIADLTERLRAAEERERASTRQNKALQKQIRELTALVKGIQRQLAELLHEKAVRDKLDKDNGRDKANEPEKPAPNNVDVTALTAEKGAEPPPKASTPKADSPPPPMDRKAPLGPKQKPIRRADPAPGVPHDTNTTPATSCAKCGSGNVTQVGGETGRRLHYVRAHLRVVDEVRETCRCRDCGKFTTPPMLPTAVPGGMMSPSLLAYIAYGKGFLHLPLSRIADDLRMMGADLASGTMCDAMKHISKLLGPLVQAIVDELFSRRLMWFDSTGIKTLEPGEKGQHLGQITVYSDAEAAVYDFTPSKHGTHAAAFLRLGEKNAFAGYLHADAASNANLLYKDGTIKECGCWYHAYDMFKTAHASAPDDADTGIAWIVALFDVEHAADEAGDTPEQRLARRHRDSQPVLHGFTKWMAAVVVGYSIEEDLPKATRYAHNQWIPLTRFLEDGRIHLTNNRAERDLGPVGRGRKAWLHAGSDEGGDRLADVYTIVETCRREDIDPYKYLVDVLPLLSTMPANRGRLVVDLTPKAWKTRELPAAT